MWAERTPSNDGTKSKDQPPVFTPKLVLGFLVLIAGILLTLDSVDLVDSSRILRYWPAGLIALGLVMVVHARDGNGRGGGIVIILVGGLLLRRRRAAPLDLNTTWPQRSLQGKRPHRHGEVLGAVLARGHGGGRCQPHHADDASSSRRSARPE